MRAVPNSVLGRESEDPTNRKILPTMKRKLLIALGVVSAGVLAQAGPIAWNVNIGGLGGNVGFGVTVGNIPPPSPVVVPVPPPVAVCPPPPCVVAPPPVVVVPPRPPRRHWRRPVVVVPAPVVCAPVVVAPPPRGPWGKVRPGFPQPPVMVVRR